MLFNCPCEHCGNRIEFEAENAGQLAQCPNCGRETTLYVSKSSPSAPASPGGPSRPVLKIAIAIGIVAAIGSVAYLVFTYDQFVRGIGALGGGILGLIIVVFLFILALLWVLFPVLVYFSLRRLEALLQKTERVTRRE